jgi:hypothetical protein
MGKKETKEEQLIRLRDEMYGAFMDASHGAMWGTDAYKRHRKVQLLSDKICKLEGREPTDYNWTKDKFKNPHI